MRVGFVEVTPIETTVTRYRLTCSRCHQELADSDTEASAIGWAEHHSMSGCDSLRSNWPLGDAEEKPEPQRRLRS